MGNCPGRLQQGLPRRAQQGNYAAQSLRARSRWHQAVQVIARVLRLRKRWAALGKYLQAARIQDLVKGLERRQGQLVRAQAAAARR